MNPWPKRPIIYEINTDERRLVVVNLAEAPSQGMLRVPWSDLPGVAWQLAELLGPGSFLRSGDEMHGPGI